MLVEGFGRGLPAEDLPGSVVERVLDREEFFKTPTGEVGSLREVLAEQPVGVLVRGALPWRVRLGEEHLDAGVDRELCVGGQFLASVPGERTYQPGRHESHG